MSDQTTVGLLRAINRRLIAEAVLRSTPQWSEYQSSQADLDKLILAARKEAKIPPDCLLMNTGHWICPAPKPDSKE